MGMKNLTANVTSANEKVISRGFTFQQEQLITSDKLTEEELQTSLLAIGVSGSQQLLTYEIRTLKKHKNL